jgi:uncharacterized protein (TIGR02271 family)
MRQTVIGLFNKSSDAQQAVQRLLSNGFTNDNVDISLGTTSATTSNTIGNTSSTTGNTNFDLDDDDRDEHESGISRFFKNLFGDDDDTDVNRYSKASRGKSIVTVHAMSDEEARRASDILDDAGAVDVDEDDNAYNYGTTGAAPVGAFNDTTGTTIGTGLAADTTTGTTTDTTTGTGYTGTTERDITNTSDSDITDKTIPIIEENIEVGKRTVQTGGVRVKSRIVEKPVEEDLRLRTERVYVQRKPVDRPASEADFTGFREGEVEVTEHAEVPVVNKEARVVEEVSLGKDVDERTETVRDTVRKTEVDIDNLENKSSSDTTWRNNS